MRIPLLPYEPTTCDSQAIKNERLASESGSGLQEDLCSHLPCMAGPQPMIPVSFRAQSHIQPDNDVLRLLPLLPEEEE